MLKQQNTARSASVRLGVRSWGQDWLVMYHAAANQTLSKVRV